MLSYLGGGKFSLSSVSPFMILYFYNYADGNTLYAFGYNLEEIENTLRFDFDLVSKWFEEHYMVLNADQCHFICLGKDTENETFIKF